MNQGIDPELELDAVIGAENQCLRAARRVGVTVGVHICLGTYFLDGRGARTPWAAAVAASFDLPAVRPYRCRRR